jgi:hypothetical protein
MKIGDLVKYMSRVILIVDTDELTGGPWAYGIELGESSVGKYKISALGKVISENET